MQPTNVNESLRQLLTELQKVKDLNNLANDYKEVAADLTLSLQQYLKESKEFSDAFNDYLVQTNQSVTETKTVVDNAIDVIRNAMKQFNVADDKLDNRMSSLSARIIKLEQQGLFLENLYKSSVAHEQQVKADIETLISKTAKDFSDASTEVVDKVELLLSRIPPELSRSNRILLDALNTTDKQIGETSLSVNQILSDLTESRKENRQTSSVIGNINNLLDETRKEIGIQGKSFAVSLERHRQGLSSRMSKIQSMEWMIFSFLVVEIILLIVLIVK